MRARPSSSLAYGELGSSRLNGAVLLLNRCVAA